MVQFLKAALPQRFAAPPISEAKRGLENVAWFQRKVCSSCLFWQSSRQVFDGETANPRVGTIAHRAKIVYAHAWRECHVRPVGTALSKGNTMHDGHIQQASRLSYIDRANRRNRRLSQAYC